MRSAYTAAPRGISRREPGRRDGRWARRPIIEGLESRRLLAVAISELPTQIVGGLPTSITSGPDGDLWFTLEQIDAIGSINPTTHQIQTFVSPMPGSPRSIVEGSDGNLWFTTGRGNIGTLNPTTHAFTFTDVPSGGETLAITSGPDGNIWFTESPAEFGTSENIGEINLTTHAVEEFRVTGGAREITSGPDGDLWFDSGDAIGSIDPTTHAIATFAVPFQSYTTNAYGVTTATTPGLAGITEGPDGNLWFTESLADRVASFNPSTHAFSTFFLPTPNSFPQSITPGADGKLWFTESAILEYPYGSQPPTAITFGTSAIASIDPTTGAIATYPTPSVNTEPQGITLGPDGAIWFTEALADQIGQAIVHPDDGPQVVSVSRYGIHEQPTTLVLTFNQALDPSSAQDLANYALVGPNRRPIKIASAVYDSTTDSVTLSPATRLNFHKTYTLTVTGTPPQGVRDTYGTLLDGAATGEPGSNYQTTITRHNLVTPPKVAKTAHSTVKAARFEAKSPVHR